MNFNIKHFVFISVLLFGSSLFSSEKISNEKYINVLSEVENILEENHFKKNVTISSNQIKEKFLNSIDSQKMVFTLSNFNELSKQTNFKKEHQVEFAFEVFKKFKEKSINFFEIQKEAILNITSENQLETQHFIFKDREDENRFDSEDQLVEYQIKEAKSELISILLKEKDLSKSKEKLLKRIVNREKSLNRISVSYTHLTLPTTRLV